MKLQEYASSKYSYFVAELISLSMLNDTCKIPGVVLCCIPAAFIRFYEASSFKHIKKGSSRIKNPMELCNKTSRTNIQIVSLIQPILYSKQYICDIYTFTSCFVLSGNFSTSLKFRFSFMVMVQKIWLCYKISVNFHN